MRRFLIAVGALVLICTAEIATAATIAPRALPAKGSVVLAQDAWYIHPQTGQRYLLRSADDLRRIMRAHAIGIRNRDLAKVPRAGTRDTIRDRKLVDRLKGRILLAVESRGAAWYVHPVTGRRHALGKGTAALSVLQHLGQRVTDATLTGVPVGGFTVEKFASAQEFDVYVKPLLEQRRGKSESGISLDSDVALGLSAPTAAPAALESAPSNTAITNVQEAGVDEGDIVKSVGDYLVVLRRGRIFTIRVQDRDAHVLTPVDRRDAAAEGLRGGAWYDEMLVSGNRIVIVGYRYSKDATEIGLFRIDGAGKLAHDATYFLDSNDYYSSRNYASRLLGSKLVFYMPYYLRARGDRPEVQLPEMRRWTTGDETTAGSPVLTKVSVYRPVQETGTPTLHTIVTCELAREPFTCSATSVLGPYARTFYVSPNAVYLWVAEENRRWWGPEIAPVPSRPSAFVYRIALTGDDVRVAKAEGNPIDQFSFAERGDALHALVRGRGGGDAMWQPERGNGTSLALVRIPLSAFGNEPIALPRSAYTPLPDPEGYGFQNRFVGDYILYGIATPRLRDRTDARSILYAKQYTTDASPVMIPLSHKIERIEVLHHNAAVVIGQTNESLSLTSVALSGTPAAVHTYAIASAAQGELRSHGFFFHASGNGGGTLGLPIRRRGNAMASFFKESAEVLFLRIAADLRISPIDSLRSTSVPESASDDGCTNSCVDWYGNTRPIFLGDRILALIGYELIEGTDRGNRIEETRRASFSPAR